MECAAKMMTLKQISKSNKKAIDMSDLSPTSKAKLQRITRPLRMKTDAFNLKLSKIDESAEVSDNESQADSIRSEYIEDGDAGKIAKKDIIEYKKDGSYTTNLKSIQRQNIINENFADLAELNQLEKRAREDAKKLLFVKHQIVNEKALGALNDLIKFEEVNQKTFKTPNKKVGAVNAIDKQSDLKFLIADEESRDLSEEIAEDILANLDRDEDRLVKDFNSVSGIKYLKHGGANGHLQAVLQMFLENESLAMFFLKEHYRQIRSEVDQTMCDFMNKLYSEYYQQDFDVLKEKKDNVSVFGLQKHLKNKFDKNTPHDASEFLQLFVESLKKETNFDETDNLSMIYKVFQLGITKYVTSKNGTKSSSNSQMNFFQCTRDQDIKTYFDNRFKEEFDFDDNKVSYEIFKLPEVLIFQFDQFKLEGSANVIPDSIELPELCNQNLRSSNYCKEYQLSTVVNCSGNSVEQSEYTVNAKRMMKDVTPAREQWVTFTKNSRSFTNIGSVLKNARPQFLVYQLCNKY